MSWVSFHKMRAKFLWSLCVSLHRKLAALMQCIENMLHSWHQNAVLNLQTLKLYCDVYICKLCACIHTYTYLYIHSQDMHKGILESEITEYPVAKLS